jgi:hypothetical protein
MSQRKFEFANVDGVAVAVVEGQRIFVSAEGKVVGDADGVEDLLRMKGANESLQDYVWRMTSMRLVPPSSGQAAVRGDR